METNNIMVKIDGHSFRGPCGCNVFHRNENDELNIYRCNSCTAVYQGD